MAKARKVLMLIENCPVPVDNRVWAEATALRDSGYQVSIIGPKDASKHRESYICLDGIHIYRYRLPFSSTARRTPGAYILEYGIALLMTFLLSWKVLFRRGFDVIHTANPPDIFFLVGLFYRVLGKKFIFDQHDLSPELLRAKFPGRAALLYRLMRALEWSSYHTAHVVITTNLSQKRFALERGHCRPEQVFVVRNGPDLRRLARVPPEPALRQGRSIVIAYVGEMEAQDGVDNALRALQDLVYRRGREDILLVLMGDGGHAAALRELARELRLDAYAHFTGWLDAQDLVRYLSIADIGLVPDPRNGLNEYCTMVKTMEYMAMGIPVAAFDLPETRFSAGEAALYATPNSVEDFARAIDTLINDEALRLTMSAAGRQRIEQGLNWEHDRQALLQAYHYCREKGGKRRR